MRTPTPETPLSTTGLLAPGFALLTAGCMGTHAVHQATLTKEDVLASGTGPALADLPGVIPALELFGVDSMEAPRMVKVTGKVSRSPVTHLLVTRCPLPAADHRLDEPLPPGQDCRAGGRPEYEFRAPGGAEAPKKPDPAFTATAEIIPAEE